VLCLQNEYEEYIERLYPHWKEQVLAHAAAEKAKVFHYYSNSYMHALQFT